MSGPPYRWHPSGTRNVMLPGPGALWAHDHAVWRIIEVRPVPEVDMSDSEQEWIKGYRPQARDSHGPRYVIAVPLEGGKRQHWRVRPLTSFDVYPDEHYPICAECREPLPCRDVMAQRTATVAMKQMARYEIAGVCPACSEPVTDRQKAQTWPDNCEVLGGPPVTFHLRRKCLCEARRYEAKWVALDPERRRTLLSCKGHLTNHNDGTYECTELTECPGPVAEHPFYNQCRCPDCHASGGFSCFPPFNARNKALESGEQR